MKLLYLHTKNLRINAGVGGRRQGIRKRNERILREKLGDSLPDLTYDNQQIQAKNALLTFVCVEKGDESLDLSTVAGDVIRAKAIVGVSDIVIGSFAHLSSKVACPEIARSVVDGLIEELQLRMPDVKHFPFGWDKSFELNVPLHHYNIAFRSFNPTFNQRFRFFANRKKEWIRLNASYLAGSAVNFFVAIATAHLAQKFGVEKESASSWLPPVAGFTAGFGTTVLCWSLFHKDKYSDFGEVLQDAWTLFKNIWKAQLAAWSVIIPGAWFAASLGIATSLIVLAQQIAERIIFIPAFNFFSRDKIKEMEDDLNLARSVR